MFIVKNEGNLLLHLNFYQHEIKKNNT